MPHVEARLLKVLRHRVVRTAPLPMADQARKPRNCLFIKAKRLANFARCGAAAIGDDIRGHRRAQMRRTAHRCAE